MGFYSYLKKGKRLKHNSNLYFPNKLERGLQCVLAFSSTGRFMDDLTEVDDYTTSNTSRLSANASSPSFALYKTSRISPLVLTYYRLCLGNGNYTVSLYFSDIIITDDSLFYSFGKRVFDIYVHILRNYAVNVSY
ncbi:Malectin domain [Arabidopsis thaliana x Arabidopsis arenosa]|uniref:Malectin domain n=1 Tax=Arabidopsis thaliana x Arabidopsis arenosa TaxID=1240361 RepID=A0A8T2AUH2_9BRAS|nr:Malectin domain [Arabidopsis thaliana x Arabidopsis arenosa]